MKRFRPAKDVSKRSSESESLASLGFSDVESAGEVKEAGDRCSALEIPVIGVPGERPELFEVVLSEVATDRRFLTLGRGVNSKWVVRVVGLEAPWTTSWWKGITKGGSDSGASEEDDEVWGKVEAPRELSATVVVPALRFFFD